MLTVAVKPDPLDLQLSDELRERAFWRIITRLSDDLRETEQELIAARELVSAALAQQHALVIENYRLRRSREAEAAMTGHYTR